MFHFLKTMHTMAVTIDYKYIMYTWIKVECKPATFIGGIYGRASSATKNFFNKLTLLTFTFLVRYS